MSPPLRDTKYARELATAKLPSGPEGKSSVAIERIFVKQSEQVEIRFSWWEGARMMPRPLDLPEEELLSLLGAAIEGGVFSEAFLQGLRGLVAATAAASTPAPAPATSGDPTELDRLQAHFQELIRVRAADLGRDRVLNLPTLAAGVGTDDEPVWFPLEDIDGGFKYWWDAGASGPRLMVESWSRRVDGSGQLHEITPRGSRLLGEGFI